MTDPILIETVVAAAAGATRRLTTKENVKTLLDITVTTYDTLLDSLIDRVSEQAAIYCNLARDNAGAFPTFGAETLKATWRAYSGPRCDPLLLPWRTKLAITSLTDDTDTLVAETDYRFDARTGEIFRLSGGVQSFWDYSVETVAQFTCGWTLPGGIPPGLESEVIEQVKFRYLSRARDPAIRSRTVQDVGSQTFSVAGGDSISESGLLPSLESALDPYRRQPV